MKTGSWRRDLPSSLPGIGQAHRSTRDDYSTTLSAGEQAERTILKLPTPFLEAKAISSGISESRIHGRLLNDIRGTHECVSSLRRLLNIGINRCPREVSFGKRSDGDSPCPSSI